jgi:hypothetical protein
MNHIKTFLLGVGVAYTVYYITRKGDDGRSLLDELLDHPEEVIQRAKKQALVDVVETVKERMA